MFRILAVLLALSISVEDAPITSCRRFPLWCNNSPDTVRDSGLYNKKGIIGLSGLFADDDIAGAVLTIGTKSDAKGGKNSGGYSSPGSNANSAVGSNAGAAASPKKDYTVTGSNAGGAYGKAGSDADSSSIASAGSNADAGSNIAGQSNAKATGLSQSGSRQILKDASAAYSSSFAHASGKNKDGDRKIAGAAAGADALNLGGQKGIGIDNKRVLSAAAAGGGKDSSISAGFLTTTGLSALGKKVNAEIGLAASLDPKNQYLKPMIKIYEQND